MEHAPSRDSQISLASIWKPISSARRMLPGNGKLVDRPGIEDSVALAHLYSARVSASRPNPPAAIDWMRTTGVRSIEYDLSLMSLIDAIENFNSMNPKTQI